MRRWPRRLFALSALIPLAGLINAAATYSVFVAAWFWRERHPRRAPATRRGLLLALFLGGMLLELFAWTGNFVQGAAEPPLFHPQLIPDLLLGMGFYAGWVVAWALLLRFTRFSLRETVVLMGLYGVVVEQNGAVLMAGWAALPVGVLLWLYVFAAYGGAAGLAYVWANGTAVPMGRYGGLLKYPAAFILLYFCVQVTFIAWGLLVDGLGLIPPPRPMWDAPLW